MVFKYGIFNMSEETNAANQSFRDEDSNLYCLVLSKNVYDIKTKKLIFIKRNFKEWLNEDGCEQHKDL